MSGAEQMVTAFVGLSHLGLVSSIGWASHGLETLGIDADTNTVSRLCRGELTVREPGLAELLEATRDRISFSSDFERLAECALIVLSYDVPTDANNISNLDAIWSLIDTALPHLSSGSTLVLMSQVPPGFTRAVSEQVRLRRPELDIRVLYWVETLIFGDAVRRTLHPERFIVGCPDPAQSLPAEFEAGLRQYGCPILAMTYESAELTKTAINLYLVGSVTYANTLADLCEAVGANWSEMVPALQLDARIGPSAYLRPGLGVAGGNLERDLMTLSDLCDANGVDTTYLLALIQHNAQRFAWVRRQLAERVFDRVREPAIAIWGLTYKKNTNSTKNSPALRLIGELQQEKRIPIRVWDPAVNPAALALEVDGADTRDAVLPGSDCLVIMTDWDQFACADFDVIREALRQPLIIDSVGVLEGRRREMEGIEYVTMGHGGRGA